MINNIQKAIFFVFSVWLVFILDIIIPIDFNNYGILPRTLNGLIGIPASPFLHANIFHIISNTVPLFILLLLLFTFYKKEAIPVIIIIVFVGGILVWLFGRKSYHIGASGLIYGLASFLIASGIFRKNIVSIIVSLIVFFLYGGLIYGIIPRESHISWEAHLFGALAGIFCSYILFKKSKKIEEKNNSYKLKKE